ncbi:MAG: ADP-ribosylglycohydrolase family protein [Alsobacter sp.]
MAAVIGLGGDVDTLGAIVGGLMGVRLGRTAVPDHLCVGVLHSARLHRLGRDYARLIVEGSPAERGSANRSMYD